MLAHLTQVCDLCLKQQGVCNSRSRGLNTFIFVFARSWELLLFWAQVTDLRQMGHGLQICASEVKKTNE